jgi:hypothetical protein
VVAVAAEAAFAAPGLAPVQAEVPEMAQASAPCRFAADLPRSWLLMTCRSQVRAQVVAFAGPPWCRFSVARPGAEPRTSCGAAVCTCRSVVSSRANRAEWVPVSLPSCRAT